MRNLSVLVAVILVLVGGTAVAANSVIAVGNGSEHWTTGARGIMQVVLLGNPKSSGFYVTRLKEIPNYRILPHTHPQRQNITVISGSYYLGLGTTFDRTKATAYGPGSFISIPAGVAHYAFAGPNGAVVQEDGMGPNRNDMLKK